MIYPGAILGIRLSSVWYIEPRTDPTEIRRSVSTAAEANIGIQQRANFRKPPARVSTSVIQMYSSQRSHPFEITDQTCLIEKACTRDPVLT